MNDDLNNLNNIARLSLETLKYAEKTKKDIEEMKDDINKTNKEIDEKVNKVDQTLYAASLIEENIVNKANSVPSKADVWQDIEFLKKKAELAEQSEKRNRNLTIGAFIILVIASAVNFFI